MQRGGICLSAKIQDFKKEDVKKWAVVEYLKENGFFYHHIMREFECIDSNGIARIISGCAKIPETMKEAK